MVLSTLQDSMRVEGMHPLFKKALDYVKTHNLLSAQCGRVEIDGDKLFINNSNPVCVKAEEQVLEVHRQYIDIHILLEGVETIGWKPLADCHNEVKAFDEAADCALFGDVPSTYVTMMPGQMLIVWPEDAHAPIIGEGSIRKLIVKVKL